MGPPEADQFGERGLDPQSTPFPAWRTLAAIGFTQDGRFE
jgi:hypothetical protein